MSKLSRKHKDRIWKILIEENRHIAANWKSRVQAPKYHEVGDDEQLMDAVLGITEVLQGANK